MKRREMLSKLALLSTPLISVTKTGWALETNITGTRQREFGAEKDWFLKKRFGMFVHWGLYAIPAWHEQYQWRAGVSRAEYSKLIHEFNPQKFSADKWLDLLQDAGMEYLTFTTKHHDGFCMWDTAQTDFNIMRTPYKADILRKLADACHARKIPLCLYYSIADWHHRNYPNMGRHHELLKPEIGDQPNWQKYMEFLKAQVKELCSNYGEIHGFWWDMNVPEYKDPSVNAMIRKLQPNIMINNRGFDEGDFGTPERDYGPAQKDGKPFSRPTEACQSVGSLSWGYKKDEEYFSDKYLMNSIDRYLSLGANYLLNIGPDAEGQMPEKSSAILRRIGKWYSSIKESYTDVALSSLISDKSVSLTRRKNILYIHFNSGLNKDGFSLKPINKLPVNAVLLNNGKPVTCVLTNIPGDYPDKTPYLRLHDLPVNELSDTMLVVKLEFDSAI